MTGLRRIRGLGRRIAPVAVAAAVGALASVALVLAVPGPSRAPAAPTPTPTPTPSLSPPDPALAPALASLDEARVRDRAALHRARTPSEQAMLADRLADDHLVALTALRGRGAAPLEERLAATRHAYESLHEAAAERSASRYEAARRAVQAAETRLRGAVDDALQPQVARVAAPVAVARPDAAGSSSLLDWALIVAALGAGFVIGLVRPASRLRVAAAPPATASS